MIERCCLAVLATGSQMDANLTYYCPCARDLMFALLSHGVDLPGKSLKHHHHFRTTSVLCYISFYLCLCFRVLIVRKHVPRLKEMKSS